MISLLVIWVTSFFKDLLRLHEEIDGRWRAYLCKRWKLRAYGKANPKGRLDLHDVWSEAPEDGGFFPFKEEVEYANPKMNQSEDLYIIGVNTGEQTTLEVSFKRRPLPQSGKYSPPQDQVEVSLRLVDLAGNVYSMAESSVVDFSPGEYRASGFAFESLHANRTGRIKFRGYLQRNDEPQLVYVQARFLTLFSSKTFDHQRVINQKLLAKELLTDSIGGSIEELLEDAIEQNCHIKGTFQVEAQDEVQLFFLGNLGKRFLPVKKATRKVVQIRGFTESGISFHVGLVSTDGRSKFRYGYIINGFNNAQLLEEISLSKDEVENVAAVGGNIAFEAKFEGQETSYKFEVTRNDRKKTTSAVKVNGASGIAFITERVHEEVEKQVMRRSEATFVKDLANELVVALEEDCARVTDLTGGKGASLAQLKKLSEGKEWTVPNAVVVTCSAFKVQTDAMSDFEEKLEALERRVKSGEEAEKSCKAFVDWFAASALHEKVQSELKAKMEAEFGSEWESLLLAVRSSASGEDSGEMSAAGQMTTYLGLSGLGALSRAVVSCWASQFGFVPVTYKRGYGQPIGVPMAVVVQRIVDCQAAGVIFTARPTDGDERILTVSANFGLGESVVSAAAEPDNFTLAVDIQANSYQVKRAIKAIAEKTLGKKALVTRLNPQGANGEDIGSGIQDEQATDRATLQSLTDDDLLRLGGIALEIAAHYGNPRDIEFGIKDGAFHLFQSRPITNLDSSFTNYELMHEMDTPHSSEAELYSRNHWGENFPGSSSWQCALMFLGGTGFAQGAVKQGQMKATDFNYLRPNMGYICNQLMFNLKGSSFFLGMLKDYPKSDAAVANAFAFFGRHITNPDFLASIKETSEKLNKENGLVKTLMMPLILGYMLFFGCRKIPTIERELFTENKYDMKGPVRKVALKEKKRKMFEIMAKNGKSLDVHGAASFGSSLKSQFLMKLLKSSPDTSHIESDLNLLMSHCNDVVSAEVPNMLREIARAISDREAFVQLTDGEALELLQASTKEPVASQLFAAFLVKHSHRGYREFDPLHLPWGQRPLPCVQVIKSMIKGGSSLEPKKEKPIGEIMAELKTPLSWWKKAAIQYWFLPWVRDAVGFREHTKSIMIKMMDLQRQTMWHIAEEMVDQGFLPEADLYFYLRVDEIQRLTAGERNPSLVMKARQRKRLYPKMNALKFDEFVKGFRMAPRPPKKEIITLAEDSVSLSGTAVTVGAIKARVCVAETIEEAVNIQAGDILLTYSTDIGWSPYFPLISGICTEIGGTISHGAVIAREFGIPCLIAVEDVCSYFKTGDTAYLDTKTGTIVKVKE